MLRRVSSLKTGTNPQIDSAQSAITRAGLISLTSPGGSEVQFPVDLSSPRFQHSFGKNFRAVVQVSADKASKVQPRTSAMVAATWAT
jgi:hypothetical protein